LALCRRAIVINACQFHDNAAIAMKRLTSLSLLILGVLLISTDDAYAYLDPGTGSILLQGLIAGIAAASFVIGGYWTKVKTFFSSGPKGRKAQGRPADPPEQ
jgi:hypothetical protein